MADFAETKSEMIRCLSCAHELPTEHDVRQIDVRGARHCPFCFSCAEPAKRIPFDQWLDEQWQRQNPN
jgi:hypothetical protein